MNGIDVGFVIHPFWLFTFWLFVGFIYSAFMIHLTDIKGVGAPLIASLAAAFLFSTFTPTPETWVLGAIIIGALITVLIHTESEQQERIKAGYVAEIGELNRGKITADTELESAFKVHESLRVHIALAEGSLKEAELELTTLKEQVKNQFKTKPKSKGTARA